MAVFQNNLLAGAGAQSGSTTYAIDQSIRFNSADTAYMHRTPSSTGNRKTFTSSFWVKLGTLGVNTALPMPGVTHGVGSSGLSITTAGLLNAYIYYSGSWSGLLISNRVFRDPSAFYHFCCVVDTTQAVASERIRIYVNGQRETSFSTANYPSQNTDTDWNLSGEKMWIGIDPSGSGYNGEYYASEIVYIDGTAYGPENFGEYTSSNIWIPKDVSGLTFGTNGFHIDGRDSADLGDDESGQGNDFSSSGLAAHDQVPDSPTNNWCTWNVVDKTPTSVQTISNGNLQVVTSGATSADGIAATQGLTSGKWYWESYLISASVYNVYLGIKSTEVSNNKLPPTNTPDNSGSAVGWWGVGIYKDGSAVQTGLSSPGISSVSAVFLDLDSSPQTIQFYLNGSTLGSAVELASGFTWLPINSTNSSGYAAGTTSMINFGQDSTFGGQITASANSDANGLGNFKYSVPSNALAICTKNLGS